MRIRTTLAGLATAALVAFGAAPASAAGPATGAVKLDRSPTAAEWEAGTVACLLTVTGQAKTGELLHGDPECWLVEKGAAAPWSTSSAAAGAGASAPMAESFTEVGTHYDGFWWSGSYITVAGTVCSGGWLNLSWDWINRISSTSSPCWVGHYDGYNLTGSSQWGSVFNLGFMNNAANSLVYA